ncbi:SAF domain-containing protein [Candidatus Poriferisodalis sp.]|uniref:SAF domain-containing protein n=1 Tax=Candidatus Poriferisodalis sp. TaxID=3101277 RepID=UPI003C6F3536
MPTDSLLPTGREAVPAASRASRRAAPAHASIRPRVIAGCILCGAAALGLWWAFEQSAAAPETSYFVARNRLAPGSVIEPTDVALVPIQLPPEVSATVFGDGDDVVGNLVVGAVHAGQLLTRGDVGSLGFASDRREGYAISVELDRSRALNGLLTAGEQVDVVATDRVPPNGAAVVATGALVLDVDGLSGTEHLSNTITVTLQVSERVAAVSVAAAADAGAITLIRAWGASNPVGS